MIYNEVMSISIRLNCTLSASFLVKMLKSQIEIEAFRHLASRALATSGSDNDQHGRILRMPY